MLNLKDPSLLKTQNFIDGQWADGGAGTIDVTNPANGEAVATVANGDAADAVRAVEAAAEAFKSWSNIPAKQRAVLLRNWYDLLIANADDLGAIMTAEQGKPLAESIAEVGSGASFIEYYAEESKRVLGATIPTIAKRQTAADLQAACRRCWLYYTLEFPKRYDRAQSRACPWIGLHHCY